MDILRRKKREWDTERVVIEHHEKYVVDWHETFQFWVPRAIALVVCGLGFYATLWPGFFVPIILLVLASLIDKIFERWGRLIRVIGWGLLIFGLLYLINVLNQFPQPLPPP